MSAKKPNKHILRIINDAIFYLRDIPDEARSDDHKIIDRDLTDASSSIHALICAARYILTVKTVRNATSQTDPYLDYAANELVDALKLVEPRLYIAGRDGAKAHAEVAA